MKNSIIGMFLICVLFGVISGALITSQLFQANYSDQKSEEDLILEYYLVENAVSVSPHGLRVKMDSGYDNYVLVDLRSQEEYEKEHIIGAINIPAYRDKFTPDYDNVERIVGGFAELSKDKEIIVYCYSAPCMSGRRIGKLLAENGIYVKHLNIGWNEWRYYWELWNHEPEWEITSVEEYVFSGVEPGTPIIRENTSLCNGDLGC